jgi:threonine 3-dehydrogenase
VPALALRPVPKDIPLDHLTMMEPLGIAVRAVTEAGVAGAHVLVLGCGPIGLFTIAAAKIFGAASIIAVDVSNYRRHLAEQLGAITAVNSLHESSASTSADVMVDTAGSEAAFASALTHMRKGARVVFASLPDDPFALDITHHIVLREITISGIYGRRIDETWIQVERLLRTHGAILSRILTHRFALIDFEEAFALAASRNAGKIVLYPK